MVYACHILRSSSRPKSSGLAMEIERLGLAFWRVSRDRWNARLVAAEPRGVRTDARVSHKRGSAHDCGPRLEAARQSRRSRHYEQARMGRGRERLAFETTGRHLESFAGP